MRHANQAITLIVLSATAPAQALTNAPYVADNVQAALAIPGLAANDVVDTVRYFATSAIGEGANRYIVRSATPRPAQDAGSVIWIGTGTLYLEGTFPSGVNVYQFGALGNAIGDSTAAFNAAAAYSKEIFVPPGTFNLSEWYPVEKQVVRGAGHERSILRRFIPAEGPTNNTTVIVNQGFVEFYDIAFDGRKHNDGDGDPPPGANNVVVTTGAREVSFVRCSSYNAQFNEGYGSGIVFSQTSDESTGSSSRVVDCDIHSNGTTGITVDRSWNIQLLGNSLRSNGGAGISFNHTTTPQVDANRNFVVTGNLCHLNSGSGIEVLGYRTGYSSSGVPIYGPGIPITRTITVSNNVCRSNDLYGIGLQGASIACTGNTCSDNGKDTGVYAGILFNCEYSSCSGNTCTGNEYFGIDAGGCYRCEIVANNVRDSAVNNILPGGVGINLGGGRESICANNYVRNAGDTIGGTGIYVPGGDGDGNPMGGYPWVTERITVIGNTVHITDVTHRGVFLDQGPRNIVVKDNLVIGGEEFLGYVFECNTLSVSGNHHIWIDAGNEQSDISSWSGPVPTNSQLEIPDHVEIVSLTSAVGASAISSVRTKTAEYYNTGNKVAGKATFVL